jgi:hypothetical protein
VQATKGRISAKRLLPAARTAGYAGSARNFRRLVAAEKQAWRATHHRGRRPAVWAPGEVLVIDWGSQDGLHLFCAVLAWSRFRFVRFATDERAETTLGLLAECFAALGGVPKVVLADRMGCLKAGVVANVVVPTPEYVRLATHYGFRPDFCQGGDPESKGIVEHLVGYAKRDLLVPQAPFTGLAVANDAARAWCAEVNSQRHSETAAVPAERLAAEQELLGALPSLRLRLGTVTTRKVDRLSCVRFGSARYSVPTRLIGAVVELVSESSRVRVVDTATGEVVADHALVAPGRPRSPMRTTAGPGRRPGGRCDPRPLRRRRSAPSARSRRRSSPALPRPGTPGWAPNWPSSPGSRQRTAGRCCWPRWNARSPSAGGARQTCAPSWTPAPAPHSPARLGRRWCWSCPWCRPGRWPTTPSTDPGQVHR